MMVPGKPFPRLSLPAKPRSSTARPAVKVSSEPVQDQPYADALFRRIATQILRKEIVRRIKKIRRKIAAGQNVFDGAKP
jgi:hypothetical protein